MRRLTDAELRFLIEFEIGQLEPALIVQLRDKNELRRRMARQIVTDRLVARFAGHEVYAPDPLRPPG
jgi:hypothetical protein